MPHARTGTRAAPRHLRYLWPASSACPCGSTEYTSNGKAKQGPRRYRKCKVCGLVYTVRATHEEVDEGGPLGRIRPL